MLVSQIARWKFDPNPIVNSDVEEEEESQLSPHNPYSFPSELVPKRSSNTLVEGSQQRMT